MRNAWHVYAADFVSSGDGTGIVHIAPAFGADDYALGQKVGLPVLRPVDDRGAFREDLPLVGGRFVKDADTDLVIDLKGRGQVFKSSREEHSYPHCWRCQSPLLYMARDSWFIRTTAVRDQLLANNAQVNWFPPEMGAGRFGEWLENNVDWAISRNRYWGTPLPAWVCDAEPRAHRSSSARSHELEAEDGAQPSFPIRIALRGRAGVGVRAVRRDHAAHAGGDRRLVRLRRHAVRPAPLPVRERGRAGAAVPGGVHLRGRGPDARVVLLAAGHLARCWAAARRTGTSS